MMNKVFSPIGWTHYQHWVREDRKIVKKINALLEDIERNGNEGTGKPEPLKNELSGFWSRRITEEHRLIYSSDDDNIFIVACRGHYR